MTISRKQQCSYVQLSFYFKTLNQKGKEKRIKKTINKKKMGFKQRGSFSVPPFYLERPTPFTFYTH